MIKRKNYLVDTHCLIWFQEDNPNIPSQVMAIIQDTTNTLFFSQISLFEIAIKQNIGKLPDFSADLSEIYQQAIKDDFVYLPISNQHLFAYQKIPLLQHHRDPFDRLLLATAYYESATILSTDSNFGCYSDFVEVLW